jgi:NAD+ diphosphatase
VQFRFLPDTSSTAKHERRTWLVIHPKGLVARRSEKDDGRIIFPTDDEITNALGLTNSSVDAHRLGTLTTTAIGDASAASASSSSSSSSSNELVDTDALAIPITGRIEPPFELFGLRMLAAFLDPDLFGVVGRAMHACDWLTTTRFCGRCGTPTKRSETERSSVCPSPTCGLHTYPRISPAIITLVRKGDLALLANNAKFPGAFYSTLAGFADIGESLEETLVREVKEEVGISVDPKSVRYFGSQPWPFPNSLMIAFTVEWQSGDIEIDPAEIADAKWFSVNDLPMIPPPLSIARRMIDAWIEEVSAEKHS